MSKVVEVENLCKHFDGLRAIENISFSIERGQTCALLGGNGAGKTTTISIMLGLLLPSSGNVKVLNVSMLKDRYKVLPKMNFTSPYVDLPHRLTVKQNLTVYARLYGIRAYKKRLAQLSNDLEIDQLLNRAYGSLSAGQRTRVSLAKSLLNEPEVLLMDEPTASLDPDTADNIRSYIAQYQKQHGATLLLASHNMNEVERLCDNVIMLKNGSIVAQGAPGELRHKYGRNTMEEVFLDIARNEAAG